MPKKTKKEKIIAEYRRKLQSKLVNEIQRKSDILNSSAHDVSALSTTPVYNLKSVERKNPSITAIPATEATLSDIMAIRHDLAKTLTLAAVAIMTELLLSWKIGR